MKKFLFTLAIGLFTVAAFAQQEMKPVGGSGPMISVDTDHVDYGTIKQNADGYRSITVTNTGDQPLLITQCKGSCGCTVPECQKEPIMPGKTSTVKVKYDTNRVGPFNKTVTITSNAQNEPNKQIKISGTVEAAAGTQTGHEGHSH